MKTLPSPSTASPVNAERPATNTRWSAAWPGTCSAVNGPKASPSRSGGIAPHLRTAEPCAQRRQPLGVVGVVVRERDPAGPATRRHGGRDGVEVVLERRPRVDDPRRLAPDDPRVRPAERERRGVRRPYEQHLHRYPRGTILYTGPPSETAYTRPWASSPNDDRPGTSSDVRRMPRARPGESRADSMRPLQ